MRRPDYPAGGLKLSGRRNSIDRLSRLTATSRRIAMFIYKTQLRYRLSPEQYFSESHYRDELEHLFRPAWHLVATTHDLGRPGDFISLDLLEQPVLVRNMDGQLRAFLNVCPHRHSRLTSLARGSSPRLKCQYHGWEYDAEGHTGRIPDAQSFRPFDRENSCLTRFRVATCGDLVFVSLAADGPSLEEFLGPIFERGADSFGGRYRLAGSWERDFACNWKVIIENSLESYHLPSVHPKTFGMYSPEEDCAHVIEDGYTMSRVDKQHRPAKKPRRLRGKFRLWWRTWLPEQLGVPARYGYEHHNIHPHVTFASNLFHRQAMIVYPTSPTTSRVRHYVFSLHGDRRGPLASIVARGVRTGVLKTTKRLFAEDATIYEEVQRGLAASPYTGVIGTREERIFGFQEYVLARCGGAGVGTPIDTDAGANAGSANTARSCGESQVR